MGLGDNGVDSVTWVGVSDSYSFSMDNNIANQEGLQLMDRNMSGGRGNENVMKGKDIVPKGSMAG